MSFLGVVRFVVRATVVTLLVSITELHAQTIRGTVFDSLIMRPVSGASVWVQGATQTAVADTSGNFELVGVQAGERFIAFSSPALDSIGLGTLGANVVVGGNSTASLRLASPSFATVARALCRGTAFAADSGIAWGTVRDADRDVRLSNARTVMEWSVPNVTAEKQISMKNGSREVRTDSTGTYVACGVPTEASIAVEASGAQSASGVVAYSIGSHRVLRLDLLVSKEMAALSARSSATAKDTSTTFGTASISGIVHDDKQHVVSNATISIAAVDTSVRTNADGRFVFRGLPAGTNMLDVRQPGLAPYSMLVDLLPGKTVDVAVSLSSLSELDAVKVIAAREATRDRDAFEARRREGFGHALTQKDLVGRSDIASALQSLPSLTLVRSRGQLFIRPPQGTTFTRPCSVKVWIDGIRASLAEANALQVADVRAIEWYPTASSAPPTLMADCSTLVLWTARSKWGD